MIFFLADESLINSQIHAELNLAIFAKTSLQFGRSARNKLVISYKNLIIYILYNLSSYQNFNGSTPQE